MLQTLHTDTHTQAEPSPHPRHRLLVAAGAWVMSPGQWKGLGEGRPAQEGGWLPCTWWAGPLLMQSAVPLATEVGGGVWHGRWQPAAPTQTLLSHTGCPWEASSKSQGFCPGIDSHCRDLISGPHHLLSPPFSSSCQAAKTPDASL